MAFGVDSDGVKCYLLCGLEESPKGRLSAACIWEFRGRSELRLGGT